MTRLALVLAVVLALAGCGTRVDSPSGLATAHLATSTPTSTPSTTPPITPLPSAADPTNHMTGTYPAHCQAVTDIAGHVHPDLRCTPGLVRDDITQANIATTICVKGYTSNPRNPGARPPASNTEPYKRAAMAAYGMPASASSTTEGDHDVPLELGGMNAAQNYWPEPSDEPGHGTANSKDKVENDLHAAVCSGRVPLAQAQTAIATDWPTAEARLGIDPIRH